MPTVYTPRSVALLASAARTATTQTTAQDNSDPYYPGVWIITDVTAVSGTSPTLTLEFQVQDPTSTNYAAPFKASNAITATGTYAVYVGIGGGATGASTTPGSWFSVAIPLPDEWRISYIIGGTSPSFTFSSTGILVPA